MGSLDISYKSASVFALVTTPEPVRFEREILVVIDKGSTKKKLPGGGTENEEPEVATGVELYQETGLRGFKKESILVETHKTSRENSHEIHKDIFFLSFPIKKETPIPGDDIECAAWESVSDVLRQVQKRGFVPNHASAIVWWLVRDEFLKTGNRERIQSILLDSNLLLIGLKERTLVLCLAPRCEECAKRRTTGLMSPPAFFGQNDRFKIEEEKITEIEGETYLVIYTGNRFDDFVLFEPTPREGVFLLPRRTLERARKVEDIPRIAAEDFGGEFTLIGCRKTEYSNIVLLHLRKPMEQSAFTPVCVSSSPSLNFAMHPEAWHAFLAAAPVLEGYSFEMAGRTHRPIVNRRWKTGWQDRVPKYSPKEDQSLFARV